MQWCEDDLGVFVFPCISIFFEWEQMCLGLQVDNTAAYTHTEHIFVETCDREFIAVQGVRQFNPNARGTL